MKPISDVFLHVDLGRCNVSDAGDYKYEIDFRETQRITLTTDFSVEKVRDYAHQMLDVMLDDLADRIKAAK